MPPAQDPEGGVVDPPGDDEPPPPGLKCGPSHVDDVDLQAGGRVELPGQAVALSAVASSTVVCGEGFVAAIDTEGTLNDVVEVGSTCRDVASDGSSTAVVGFADGTVIVFDVSGGAVEEVDRATAAREIRGVAATADAVYVAAGPDGLLSSREGLQELAAAVPIDDAQGVAVADDQVYVAAREQGVIVLDAAGNATTIETAAPASGIVAQDGRVIVLEGAHGWELIESGQVVAQSGTQGVVVDAAFAGGHILTADGHALVRHSWGGDTMVPVGVEHRWDRGVLNGHWLRAIEPIGEGFVALYGPLAVVVNVDVFEGAPDAWLDVPSITLWAEDGEPADAAYLLKNVGVEPLLVGQPQIGGAFTARLQTEGLDRADDCNDAWEIPPGGSALIELEFAPSSQDPTSATLWIPTNDPDDGTIRVPVDGNRPALMPGDHAPDFTALTTDGDLFRLSDHRGKVVLLKMFNFGCSTCAQEFPQIEEDLVGRYDEDEFIAVGVNTAHRTAYAASLAADTGLSLPMALDLDSEAFRHYRIPSRVFPLHVVIDKDGTIVDVSNEEGLKAVQAAIEASM